MNKAQDLYVAGKLAEAVSAQTAEVKARPGDVDARGLLVEFLCLAGQLDRADAQLETILAQASDRTPGAALLRQLIRAETARRDFWSSGRVPQFTSQPSERTKLALEASIRVREKDFAGATKLLAQVEESRPHLAGAHEGKPFDDVRDLDDRVGGVLEVLTSTGAYYWVALEELSELEFEPPERPLDLLWRRAKLDLCNGPEGVVFVPAIYAPSEGASEAHALGRATDWIELGSGGAMRGQGQRVWLVGDEALPVLELGKLEFRSTAS